MGHLKQDKCHVIRVASLSVERHHGFGEIHGVKQPRWEKWSDKTFFPFCSLDLGGVKKIFMATYSGTADLIIYPEDILAVFLQFRSVLLGQMKWCFY